MVLDAEHSPALSAILKQLNPQIAAGIINPRKDGTAVALEIGAALNQGALVTMLGDRAARVTRRSAWTSLATCRFPDGALADRRSLHVPVVLCAGLYRGGNRYDLHFELLTEQLHIDRPPAAGATAASRPALRRSTRSTAAPAPYNWFNFYDFWNDRPPGDVA